MKRRKIFRIVRFVFIFLLVWYVSGYFRSQTAEQPKEELTYGGFIAAVESGEVASVTILSNQDQVEGEFIEGHDGAIENKPDFKISYPGESEDEIEALLRERGVDIEVKNPSAGMLSIILGILPFLFIVAILVWLVRMQGGGAIFKKKKQEVTESAMPTVTFQDVAGVPEAVEQVQDIRDYLKNPAKWKKAGVKGPRGVLLYGPPGSGKTLLARAIAGEAGVPFFKVAGSDFVELFVGNGARRVRDLFAQARAKAPAIVFIDEIDAVGRTRGAGIGGGNDEREQTLNQILVELDGFDGSTGVIVIAATNRPDVLDSALLRSGRFDRKIEVGAPDIDGRIAILKVHARGKPVVLDAVDEKIIGHRMYGMTGADIENVVNEALIVAMKAGEDPAGRSEFLEAVDQVQLGPERKSRRMTEADRLLTAVHEAGHTLVGMVTPKGDPVHKVTIAPRGMAGGFTMHLPEEESAHLRRAGLLDNLAMSLGGRVAEEAYLGDVSTGASNDFEKATSIAKKMVKRWGMGDHYRYRVYGGDEEHPFLGAQMGSHRDWSDAVAEKLDEEINRLLDAAAEEARVLLAHYGASERTGPFQSLVDALLERETLHAEEISAALGDVTRWTRDSEGNLVPPVE